jgi:hypothetical protein
VFLFGRKEKQIYTLRRLRHEEKAGLAASLFRIKESAGRTFLRKAVFLQRSQELVARLSSILSESEAKVKSEGSLPSGTDGAVEVEDNIFDLLSLLKEDLKTQRELDQRLKDALLEAAKEGRWAGSPGEKSLIRKFAGFVEGRVGALAAVYTRVEEVVATMEEVERGN